MLNPLHSQRGITLIELMIGLTIVAILFTIGAPSFSDWIQNTRIRNAAESIMNGLQLTRAEAVRRNALVLFILDGNNSSWTSCVTSVTTTTKLTCPDVIQSRISADESTAGILVSTSEVDAANPTVTLPSPTFTGTLLFNGLGRVVTSTLTAGDNALINIENPDVDNCVSDETPGTMRCLRIVVSSGGQIRMCDPALSLATNPQGCA